MQQMEICGSCGFWQSHGGVGSGNACLTGQTRGGWTLATPHAAIKAPSRKTGSGTRGHECRALSKPWSSHSTGATLWCAAERRRGHARAGQERKHWPESVPVTQHPDYIKDKQRCDAQPARRAFIQSVFISTAPALLCHRNNENIKKLILY